MNQKMLGLLGEHADKYPKFLEEKYPHVFNKIVELWGTDDMVPYFDDLIVSKRPDRLGFPAEAVKEIWDLNKLFLQLYPQYEPPVGFDTHGDIWSLGADAIRDPFK